MSIAITDPVDPGDPESCDEELHSDYQTIPDAFTMCQGHRWVGEGDREWDCDLLIEPLRDTATLKDAQRILERAAVAYYWTAHPGADPSEPKTTLAYADAVADLAVTGRSAYATFLRGGGGSGMQTGDISVSTVRSLLNFQNRRHTPNDDDILTAINQALDRAYTVAWAIRGPTAHRMEARPELDWLAISGLDDPPHRPANVPSAKHHQNEVLVSVPAPDRSTEIPIIARYTIIADGLEERAQPFNIRRPPLDYAVRVPSDYDLVVFIHGHSSRAEEVLDLAPRLIEKARTKRRKLAVLAFDLPSNGYSTMVDHEEIAGWASSKYNTGYPILAFIESFIIYFVERLSALGIINKDKIVAVMGGSLGGNMSLRLARRDITAYPWLSQIVAWSPASTWGRSWALESLVSDSAKHEAVRMSRDRMKDAPSPSGEDRLNKRRAYFDHVFDPTLIEEVFAVFAGSPTSQPGRWYSDVWPCKLFYIRSAYLDRHEIYNDAFRRWHWRVAHEQLIFMHEERIYPGGPFSYDLIHARLMLAAGAHDDSVPDKLYSNTRSFANKLNQATGTTLWLENTGHSIHAERPDFFASEIIKFLDFPVCLAEGSWTHAHDVAIEHPDRLESVWRAGFYVRVQGRPGQRTWLHFAVPTPVIVYGHRLRVGSVMLRYRTGSPAAHIGAVHVYDGERRIAAHNNLTETADPWRFHRFDVPGNPLIDWGLGISIRVVFPDTPGAGDDRKIEISSVGCDFLP